MAIINVAMSRVAAVLVLVALLAAACGTDTDEPAGSSVVTPTDDVSTVDGAETGETEQDRPSVEIPDDQVSGDKAGENEVTGNEADGEGETTGNEAAGNEISSDPDWSVAITEVDCPDPMLLVDGAGCALATVPIDRTNVELGTTDISLLIWPGSDDDARDSAPALAVLQGGPGAASSDLTLFYPRQPYTQVFIDQRGTGFGSADFDCPELSEITLSLLAAPSDEAARLELEAYRSCANRLSGDLVWPYTNTASHAADVVDVMAALGHDRWFVYGVSYGTTIALEVLRDPPSSLIGAVLDSVLPPAVDFEAHVAFAARRALDEIHRACADDSGCSARLADFRGTVNELIQRLNAEPVTVSLLADETSLDQPVDVLIDGDSLAVLTFQLLYSNQTNILLPLLLSGMAEGDEFTARGLAAIGVDYGILLEESTDEGTYFAVDCADRLPFVTDEPIDMGAFESAILRYSTEEICSLWDMPLAPPVNADPVVSDLPVLLLSGGFDPVTPPEFAAQVAEHLSASEHVVFDGLNHGVWFGSDCVDQIVDDFLAAPQETPDISCADQPANLPWLLP